MFDFIFFVFSYNQKKGLVFWYLNVRGRQLSAYFYKLKTNVPCLLTLSVDIKNILSFNIKSSGKPSKLSRSRDKIFTIIDNNIECEETIRYSCLTYYLS